MIPRHLLIAVGALLVLALGMGFYVRSMRARGAYIEPSANTARPVAPPVSGPTELITLYVAYDSNSTLRPQSFRIPLSGGRQQRAEQLLRALLALYLDISSPHPLAAGSDLRGVYLVDAQFSGPTLGESGLAVIDLNGAFADGHRSGILVESLTVASLLQTLTANVEGIHRVKILVDGKDRETLAGHADLSNFFDASALTQMTSQLAN